MQVCEDRGHEIIAHPVVGMAMVNSCQQEVECNFPGRLPTFQAKCCEDFSK